MASRSNESLSGGAKVKDRPGMLAQTLAPLADAGANLQVIMAYHIGGKGGDRSLSCHRKSRGERRAPGWSRGIGSAGAAGHRRQPACCGPRDGARNR